MPKCRRVHSFICIILSLVLFVPSCIYAGELWSPNETQPMPCWTGVVEIESNLLISGKKVNPQITLKVDKNKITKVSFEGELRQKVNGRWKTVETWNTTKKVSSIKVSFDKTYDMQYGVEYYYVAKVKAYNGTSLLDTIDVTSPVKST